LIRPVISGRIVHARLDAIVVAVLFLQIFRFYLSPRSRRK